MIRQIYLTLKATFKNVFLDKENYLVFDKSPFYAEMGGQRGDEGTVFINDQSIIITDVVKDASGRFLHKIKEPGSLKEFSGKAILSVNSDCVKIFSVITRQLIYCTGPCEKSLEIMSNKLDHWLKKTDYALISLIMKQFLKLN